MEGRSKALQYGAFMSTETGAEGVERELKFADVDLSAVRDHLESLEAESQGPPAFEDNWIFDRDKDLKGRGAVLRLRFDRKGCRLTFKGAATFEGSVKVRPEHETVVEDGAAMRKILESLGYVAVTRYQKYREELLLGSVIIALDRTPIGDFIEIEGDGCETVARRLGLEMEKIEKRNYLKLYEDYQKEHPDASPEMVFREDED